MLSSGSAPAYRSMMNRKTSGTPIPQSSTFLPKLLATMLNFVISGIALTAVGALIPDIEEFYHINDSRMALVFPCAVAGYLCSTISIQYVHLHLGRRGLAWLSPIFRLLPAAIMSTGPKYPLVLASFFVFGFGTGLTDSGWCAWASVLPYANVVQGFLHGAFGVGCVFGPFAAVATIKRGYGWYALYRLIFVVVYVELVAQLWAFRHDTAAKYRATMNDNGEAKPVNPLRIRATWMCGVFYFVYIAIESTYSDWIVVFMRRARHTDYTTAGLASSIFWVGMSVGRVGLGPVTEHFGLKLSVVSYILISVCLQILFKLFVNVTISLILLGMNGVVLAPMFPSGLVLLATKLPMQAHVGAVAAAAAFGQIGGASVPLGVGFMADRIGIDRLLDAVLGLTVVMMVIWLLYCRTT